MTLAPESSDGVCPTSAADPMPDEPLDAAEIQRQTFVRQVVHRPTLLSTNSLALQLARGPDLLTPTLIACDHQTAGRGRGRNRWWSNPASLTFSVVIDAPPQSAHQIPPLSLAVGMAVLRGVGQFVPPETLGLKWPNDVFLGKHKVAGVLVEIPAQPTGRLVIGIGINVNTSFEQAPDEVRQRATSLAVESGCAVSREAVLISVLHQLDDHLERLWREDPGLPVDWYQACVLRGRWVELDTYGDKVTGWCEGINPLGELVLRTRSGVRRFPGGIVSHLQ